MLRKGKRSIYNSLHVLPTSTRIDFGSRINENEYVQGWDNDTTLYYIFEKKVVTKKPVYTAIASSGELGLEIDQYYMLCHDQTGAALCVAVLIDIVKITVNSKVGEFTKSILTGDYYDKKVPLMVFK